MSKADAQKRLEEIAQFESEDKKAGQLWRLKNNPQFNNLAIAYDRENKIRFVTALVEKSTAKERMRFTDVGDLANAEKQITEPHYRYFWDVPTSEDKPAYRISVYGNEPEFLSIYSLSKALKSGETEEKE